MFSAWVQTSSVFGAGYFGVTGDGTQTLLSETTYGSIGPYTQLEVYFNSGNNAEVRAYAGYWTPSGGVDTWMRVDDFVLQGF